MEQSIHEFVVEKIRLSPKTYAQIAAGSGVNKRTVEKIARGEIGDPGISHMQKLVDYFRGKQGGDGRA